MTEKLLRRGSGFSLMELLVALAIIAILLTVAVPSIVAPIARAQVDESLAIVEKLKKAVVAYYETNGVLPQDNAAAGLPAADKLIGNYITSVELRRGAFHIHFGNKAQTVLQDKVLTVRAITVPDSAASPMSWLCAYSQVPKGMLAADQDFTTVSAQYLPVNCRDTSRK